MSEELTHVQKACAYVTRDGRELLAFEEPGHEGLQVPKGTVEAGEDPREAVFREVLEESGLGALSAVDHVATDVWRRRPGRRYVRHFYHATVHEPRDRWTHEVTGEGEEAGETFAFEWVDPATDRSFALDLDDYVACLPVASAAEPAPSASGRPAGQAARPTDAAGPADRSDGAVVAIPDAGDRPDGAAATALDRTDGRPGAAHGSGGP